MELIRKIECRARFCVNLRSVGMQTTALCRRSVCEGLLAPCTRSHTHNMVPPVYSGICFPENNVRLYCGWIYFYSAQSTRLVSKSSARSRKLRALLDFIVPGWVTLQLGFSELYILYYLSLHKMIFFFVKLIATKEIIIISFFMSLVICWNNT